MARCLVPTGEALPVGPIVGPNVAVLGPTSRHDDLVTPTCLASFPGILWAWHSQTPRFTRERALVRNQPRPFSEGPADRRFSIRSDRRRSRVRDIAIGPL